MQKSNGSFLFIILFLLPLCSGSLISVVAQGTISKKIENVTQYSDKDLIIKLALSPGMPGSSSYQLLVYGNGSYTFTGSSNPSREQPPLDSNTKLFLSKKQIEAIFNKAEEINFTEMASKMMFQGIEQVDDGQQTTLSIWQNGSLKTCQFGYGNYMNKETREVANYILSLVDSSFHQKSKPLEPNK